MPPKKNIAPKKPKENPELGPELDPDFKVKLQVLTCQSLQTQLGKLIIDSTWLVNNFQNSIPAERTEDASRTIALKREMQSRVEQMMKDYEQQKILTYELRQDMTRQYIGEREKLMNRIHFLSEEVTSLEIKLTEADEEERKMEKEKDAIIVKKNDEIEKLKQQMDDMIEKFETMLTVSDIVIVHES
jgi:hypothetical protein